MNVSRVLYPIGLKSDLRGATRWPGLVWSGIRSAWRRYAAWCENRRAIHDLRGLDDRSLRDLGIGRSEITAAVLGLDVELRRRNPHE